MLPTGRATGRWRGWLMPALWLVLTVGIVFALPSLPWRYALEQVRRADRFWIGAALVAHWLILPLWAAEWRLLVPAPIAVGFARMFEVVSVTAAVLNSIPFFAGEASGFALLVARVGLSRGAALSVLAMDQLLVGFAKLAVLAAAALIAPVPPLLAGGVLTLVVAMAALALILFPLAHGWRAIRGGPVATPGVVRRLAARAVDWGQHLEAMRDRSRAWRLALLAPDEASNFTTAGFTPLVPPTPSTPSGSLGDYPSLQASGDTCRSRRVRSEPASIPRKGRAPVRRFAPKRWRSAAKMEFTNSFDPSTAPSAK